MFQVVAARHFIGKMQGNSPILVSYGYEQRQCLKDHCVVSTHTMTFTS